MSKIEPILIKKEIPIEVTVQAQAILSYTQFTAEEFLDWAINTKKISFGGHNVTEFLAQKAREESSNPVKVKEIKKKEE